MAKNKKTKLTLEETLKTLGFVIYDAMQSEQVWRHLCSPETHKDFAREIAIHIPFFNAIEKSSLVTVVIGLAKFSDTHKNALSAKKLFKEMIEFGVSTDEVEKLDGEYESCSEIWKKILVLRHNVFAHASGTISEDEAFSQAEITPNQISEAVSCAYTIIKQSCRLTHIELLDLTFRPKAARDDIESLFRNLTRIGK